MFSKYCLLACLPVFLLSLSFSPFLWLPCLLLQACQPEKKRVTLKGVMADSIESGSWVKDDQREWSSGGDTAVAGEVLGEGLHDLVGSGGLAARWCQGGGWGMAGDDRKDSQTVGQMLKEWEQSS